MPPKLPKLWDRLMKRAQRDGDCLIWKASTRNGYGQINLRRNGLNRLRYVHRLAWIANRGKIARGQRVRHSCDTPRCFNPDHLILGTAKQNTADMLTRGRLRGGWNHCHGHGEFASLYDRKDTRLQGSGNFRPPSAADQLPLEARHGS